MENSESATSESDEPQDSDGSEGGDAPENLNNLPEASYNTAFPRLYLDREHICGERVFHMYLGQTSGGSSKGKYFSQPLFVKMARQNNPQKKEELIQEYRNYKKLGNSQTNAAVVEVYGLFSYKLRSNDKWYFLIMANGGDTLDEVGKSAVLAHANKYE